MRTTRPWALAAVALGLAALAAGRTAPAETSAAPALLAASAIIGTPAAVDGTPGTVQSIPDLYLLSAAGQRLRRLTRTTDWEDQPSFSPDGRWLAFRQGPVFGHGEEGHPPVESGISIVSAAGGAVRDLSHGYEQGFADSSPTFSPDGRWILFSRSYAAEHPKIGIWLVKPDGTRLHQLSRAVSDSLAFTPDGKHYVCLCAYDDRLGPLPAVVELATGRRVRLTVKGAPADFGSATDLALSHSGKELALQTTRGVFLLPATGGKLRRVAGRGYAEPAYVSLSHLPASAAFSPGGRRLAIVGRRRGGAATIALVDRDGSGLRTITPADGSYFDPAFTP